MTIQGTASAAATNVAIPTHAVGDMILVFTRAASTTPPTTPTASGTVPAWVVPQSAGANLISLASAWFVATAANHTTGTWTGAAHICVLVLRPATGKKLGFGPTSVGNANNTQTIVYPALTLNTTAGTSTGVRCGTRTVAATTVGDAPSGAASWTQRIVQPAGSGALMVVHTTFTPLVANPVADTVSTAGSNAPYRAVTMEVLESLSGQPVVMII